MESLAQFRKQYPQYDDMSDVDLADALYERHYSDMPRKAFDQAVGIRTSQMQGFAEGVNTVAKNMEPFAASVSVGNLITSPIRRRVQAGIDRDIEAAERSGVRSGGAGKVAGEFAASLPLAYLGGPLTSGAIQGYATSDADTLGGKLVDTAFGAAGSKIASSAIDGIATAFKPAIDPAVRRLADAGVKMTPGQIKGGKALVREDKMMSRPIVGDAIREGRQASIATFNRGAIDEALKPIGVRLPPEVQTGHDAIAFAQETLDDAYGQIVPRLSVQVDDQFIAGLRELATDVQTLPKAQQSQFQGILKKVRFEPGNAIRGQQLKNAQSELGRLSTTYSTSSSATEREMGRMLREVKDELDDLMMRQNPEVAPQLQRVNAAYRGLAVLETAAKGADEGVFSTGQLKTAVRQGDRSVRKRQTAAGKAHLQDYSEAGRKVLPAKTPDSGTAGRLMQAGIASNAFGASALAGYRLAEAGSKLLLAQRPAWAEAIGEGVKLLKRPASALTITAFGAQ